MLRNNLSYNVCGQIIAYSNRENNFKTLGLPGTMINSLNKAF